MKSSDEKLMTILLEFPNQAFSCVIHYKYLSLKVFAEVDLLVQLSATIKKTYLKGPVNSNKKLVVVTSIISHFCRPSKKASFKTFQEVSNERP